MRRKDWRDHLMYSQWYALMLGFNITMTVVLLVQEKWFVAPLIAACAVMSWARVKDETQAMIASLPARGKGEM